MLSAEKKVIDFFEKQSILIFGIFVTIAAFVIRYSGKEFLSGDMQDYLLPWYRQIQDAGGLKTLREQVGNYGITYQFIIALMSYIHVSPMYLYKAFSGIFDYVLAVLTAVTVCEVLQKRSKYIFVAVYSLTLFIPSVILNSSFWGQCDSVFTSFCILAVLLLYRQKFRVSFCILGIAFAFKLQTIFLLPFFLFYYVTEKRYSILNFFWTALSFYVMCLPGFLFGRSLLDPLKIYMGQTEEYMDVYMNLPNIWRFFRGWHFYYLSRIGILAAFVALGMGLLFLLRHKICPSQSSGAFFGIACWSVWTCLLLMPAMHERYTYLLDILLLIFAFIRPKYMWVSISAIAVSAICYGAYLFGYNIPSDYTPIFYIALYLFFTVKGACWLQSSHQ